MLHISNNDFASVSTIFRFFLFLNCSDSVVFFAFHLVVYVQYNFHRIQFVLLNHRLGPTMKNRRYDRQSEDISKSNNAQMQN